MKQNKNSGASPEDLKKGYHTENSEEGIDDTPANSRWRDLDDGGFLGRPKGNER